MSDDPLSFDPELAPRVQPQSYAERPVIDGVVLRPLERFVDDGGSFLEIIRLEAAAVQGNQDFVVHQINYSVLEPGTIKAFHLHEHQSEFWFVPPESRLLVGLLDARGRSSTPRTTMRLVLGDGQARMLFIPRGVAHGVANLWTAPAPMFYLTDRHFTPEPDRCDELRLPWDTLGAAFWERERN